MLISLNWLRDSVDLPADVDLRELAERFTCTAAEVEEVVHVDVAARGLRAARVVELAELPETRKLRLVTLELAGGERVQTVSAAPALYPGWGVVYAPPGAHVTALGEIGRSEVAGQVSSGMILPGEAVGIEMSAGEAIFLAPSVAPGTELPSAWFDDWLIEVDNKSITHRPDLWGHRGIAREVAAICGLELKPYPVTPIEELQAVDGPAIPIEIAVPTAARRYTGLRLAGVPTQPAPLWMQLRLGHVGMRPISALVDLTNYVMADLGQPMHAFDGGRVDRIEVDWATEGEVFRTLDGMDRTLTAKTLMIKGGGQSIALAGVMGGLETEISDETSSLLLESANFDSATVRRTAVGLGLRTDASARFEKSLDPANTVLSIQRFVHLARECYPDLQLTSPLSDCFPSPYPQITVPVSRRHVARTMGREVPDSEIASLLEPLGFVVTPTDTDLQIGVPSFRATGDVSIEVDVIEEIARCGGYNRIPEVMPQVTVRHFAPCAIRELERSTLQYFTTVQRFNETYGYLWYDPVWLDRLGYNPGACVELRNPAAAGQERMRHSVMPNLLAATVKNRFHFDSLSLLELGSVFERGEPKDWEFRHLGLVRAARQKRADDQLLRQLKGALESWAWQQFGRPLTFAAVGDDTPRPWERSQRTAKLMLADREIGRVGALEADLKRQLDEHLAAWSVVWAEWRLTGLEELPALTEKLGTIPPHPLVEMDFSVLVPQSVHYDEVARQLATFEHPLLSQLSFVGYYEGASIDEGQRSLTFRAVLGDPTRTLVDEETAAFRSAFEAHLAQCGYGTRR